MATAAVYGNQPYAPRNALNAQALRQDILARSQKRGDAPEVRDWLRNHFWRHLVANFEPARVISTHDEARRAWGDAPLPEWVDAAIARQQDAQQNGPLVWVDPAEPALHLLETRLVEFLQARQGTALQGKLQRITCPQALALWEQEHAQMRRRIERGWRQSRPYALREVLPTGRGRFMELLPDSMYLREEMAYESYLMRHCLGQFQNRRALTGGYGEHYAQAVQKGQMRLLSFRDARGQPHITISVLVRADGSLTVEQVKGKQNRPPVEAYVDDVIACLNHLRTDLQTPADCVAIGVVRTAHDWRRIEAVDDPADQLRLAAKHPALFARLSAPAPAVLWLVAAKTPDRLRDHALSAALRYAIRPAGAHEDAAPVIDGVPWPGAAACCT